MFQNAQSLSGSKRSFSETADGYIELRHVEQENINPQLLHRSTSISSFSSTSSTSKPLTFSSQSSKEISKRNQNLVTRAATLQ